MENKEYSIEEIKSELLKNFNINSNPPSQKQEVKIPPKPTLTESEIQNGINQNNNSITESNKTETNEKQIDELNFDEFNLNSLYENKNFEEPFSQNQSSEKNLTNEQPKYEVYDKALNTSSNKFKKRKKEKNPYKNSYIYGFIFIIFSIALNVACHVRLDLGMFPSNFGLEISIILMLAGLIFLIPTEFLKVTITCLLFGFQLILNLANASLYSIMHDIITLDMIFTLGFETMDAFMFEQLDLIMLIVTVVMLLLFILTIIIAKKVAPKFKLRKNGKSILSLIILLLSIEFIGFGSYNVFKTAYFQNTTSQYLIEDNEYLYTTQNAKFATLKKYGFWSFYINNAKNFFMYEKTLSEESYNGLKEHITNNANFKYSGSTYNSDNVSGKLSGDNLIMIMMESTEWFAIDPVYTPKLYNFINNKAIKFTNYHAINKTNISEQISLFGGVPNNYSLTTINNQVGINATNSLPNLMKNYGIQNVNYFHDYNGRVYDRNIINQKIGFDQVYTLENTNFSDKYLKFGNFIDDSLFIKEFKEEIMPIDKSFFSYFTTITTHEPYNNNELYKNYYTYFDANYNDYVKYITDNNLNYLTPNSNTSEYKTLKEYKSRAIALEKSFEIIYDYLFSKGLLNNTTIVMFSDHNAYHNNLSGIIKNINDKNNKINNYNLPFVIYNKNLQSGTVDTFCSIYDIFPTICDLYGLSFNKGLVQGNSVFSNDIEKSVFVSFMGGMFDDSYYTITLDDFIPQNSNIQTNLKLSKFKQKINLFLKKQEFIDKFYQINYK